MKRLVIFDLDGTLVDTIADLAAATNYALEQFGLPTHSVQAIRSFVGNGVNKLLERSLPVELQTEKGVMNLRGKFIPYYDEHNADLSTPYPGIVELLGELQGRGVMLAVASNKYQEATEKLVAHYFPCIRFVKVLGQRVGEPIKPDPSIIFSIMSVAGVDKEEVLYVGDSGVDMQTGRNAGVDTIGVAWGFRSKAELESHCPLAVIDSADELQQFV